MRKFSIKLNTAWLLFLPWLLTCCVNESKEEQVVEMLTLSRDKVAFSVGGGIASVAIASPREWTAECDAAWLTLTQEATALVLEAAANETSTEIRETTVSILAGPYQATVLVRQEPAEAVELELGFGAAEPGAIDSEGGSVAAHVATNAVWTAAFDTPVEGWELIIDRNGSTLRVVAAPNEGPAPKTGTVTVTAGTGELAVTRSFGVSQLSRAENIYYQFLGDWNLHAPSWVLNGLPSYQSGTHLNCTLAEPQNGYAISRYDLKGLMLPHALLERCELDRETGTVTFPIGHLMGSIVSSGYEFYIYPVFFKFKTNSDGTLLVDGSIGTVQVESYTVQPMTGKISDDRSTIALGNIPADAPALAMLGYNPYLGYTWFSSFNYALDLKGEGMELRRAAATAAAAPSYTRFDSFELKPVDADNLPDGVLSELPEGTGTCTLWQEAE